MFRRLLSKLGLLKPQPSRAPLDLPSIPRDQIEHLLRFTHDLPHIDWGAADAWITRSDRPGSGPINFNPADRADRRRAVAAAWLDELRDALKVDHRRWRHALVEGVGPLEDNLAIRAARAADRSLTAVHDALIRLRGDDPIPPIAVIALARTDDYYSFISPYFPDEGEWGTSGGVYINQGPDAFPMIVMPVQVRWTIERTIAHEITHHALKGMALPLWVEEGLTQMMEERVTGPIGYHLDREMLARHRHRWDEVGLDRFWSGESFHSSHEDEQELAYHLAQTLVRGLLSQRADAFFAFARDCGDAESIDSIVQTHFGRSPDDLVEALLSAQR